MATNNELAMSQLQDQEENTNQGVINAELEYEIIQLKKERDEMKVKVAKSDDKIYNMVSKIHMLEAKTNDQTATSLDSHKIEDMLKIKDIKDVFDFDIVKYIKDISNHP